MKYEFSNKHYVAEHGKSPRGFGWWWFSFEGYAFEHTGTLTEAKQACREYAKTVPVDGRGGVLTIYVEG